MGDFTNPTEIRKLYKKIDQSGLVDNDIDFFIRIAENIVKAKLAVKYTLPFTTVPLMVKTIAQELALIKILDRFFTSETTSKNDWRTIRKEDLDALLEKIMSGEIPLLDANDAIISTRTDNAGIESDTEIYTPIFDNLNAVEQFVDPDLVDDLREEKDITNEFG